MQCRKVRQKISRYTDGELRAGELAQVEKHLQTCACCRSLCECYERTKAALDGLRWAEAPDCFPQAVRAAAEKRLQRRRPRPDPAYRWRDMPLAVRIAASMLILIGIAAGGLAGRSTYIAEQSTEFTYGDDIGIVDRFLADMPPDDISDTYLALMEFGEYNNDF